MKTSAIYQIKNLINGKLYIGSAKDFYDRKTKHINFLINGKHHCSHLQNAWFLNGPDNFEFSIMEHVELDKLIEREQFYLDKFKSYDREFGYNLNPTARSSLGSKRTPEQKLKIAASQKGIKRSEQAKINMSVCRIGKQHTPEAKARMSEAQRNISPWNCPDGSRCKCDTCLPLRKLKWKEYGKRYYEKTKKLKPNRYFLRSE